MKIILRQEVENLGEPGTLHNVAPGYARNYLIPRGLAVVATPGEMKTYENNRREQEFKIARQEQKLQSLADKIAAVTLHFEARAGENGRLFGSVTAGDVADKLAEAIGQEVDRRKVVLDEPIRHTGEHSVHVHLVGKLRPALKVIVTAEATDPETAPEVENEPAEE